MSLHFKRKLWILMVLVLIVNRAMGQDDGQAESEEEDDDSSSEETVEDSNESGNQRRRRSPDLSDFESKSVETIPQPNFAIPGLPDPSTFIKLAEMVSRLGQEVLPQVLEGNTGLKTLIEKRLQRNSKLIKNLSDEVNAIWNRI